MQQAKLIAVGQTKFWENKTILPISQICPNVRKKVGRKLKKFLFEIGGIFLCFLMPVPSPDKWGGLRQQGHPA